MISVIIPIYNTYSYLKDCFISIENQSYKNIEVLMIDDGSTDKSLEICIEWANKDERFKLFKKNNEGPSSARNLGLKNAKGEFITFIDSDDIIHRDYLEKLVNIIKKEKCMIVGTNFVRFKREYPIVITNKSNICYYKPSEAIKIMLYQNGLFNSAPWGKLYRKKSIENIWFKEGIIYEDLEWMFRVLHSMPKSSIIGICDASLYFYRFRKESLINYFSERRLDILTVTKEIETSAVAMGDNSILKAARDRVLSANFEIYLLMYNLKYQNNECEHIIDDYDVIINKCWVQIKKLRLGSLFDIYVRRKNRLGIMLSYFGSNFFGIIGCILKNGYKR